MCVIYVVVITFIGVVIFTIVVGCYGVAFVVAWCWYYSLVLCV